MEIQSVVKTKQILEYIIKQAEKKKKQEIEEKYKLFSESREGYHEKILSLHEGQVLETGESIAPHELINDFLTMVGADRSEFQYNPDDPEVERYFPVVDKDIVDMIPKDRQKDDLKLFAQKYKGITLSQVATLIRLYKAIEDNEDKKSATMNYAKTYKDRKNSFNSLYEKRKGELGYCSDVDDVLYDLLEKEEACQKAFILSAADDKFRNPEKIIEQLVTSLDLDSKNIPIKPVEISHIQHYFINISTCDQDKTKKYQECLTFLATKLALPKMELADFNEEIMEILFKNDYKGKLPNETMQVKYDAFCKEKKLQEEIVEKDKEILHLQEVINDKDETITNLKRKINQKNATIEMKHNDKIATQEEKINDSQELILENEAYKKRTKFLEGIIEKQRTYIDSIMEIVYGIKNSITSTNLSLKPRTIVGKIIARITKKRDNSIKSQNNTILDLTEKAEHIHSNIRTAKISEIGSTEQFVQQSVREQKRTLNKSKDIEENKPQI